MRQTVHDCQSARLQECQPGFVSGVEWFLYKAIVESVHAPFMQTILSQTAVAIGYETRLYPMITTSSHASIGVKQNSDKCR